MHDDDRAFGCRPGSRYALSHLAVLRRVDDEPVIRRRIELLIRLAEDRYFTHAGVKEPVLDVGSNERLLFHHKNSRSAQNSQHLQARWFLTADAGC